MKKLLLLFAILSIFSIEGYSQDAMLGEVRMFAGNFAPRGWAFCDGQLLPISQNTALFSIIGTIYGGDGRTTFALPDLRDGVPVHVDDFKKQGNKQSGTLVYDGESSTTTLNTVGLRYIIATQGFFPSRN